MIHVKDLTKAYGARKAIDNINFSIEEGEVVGFLGPNGAGKTTTMNIMTGFIAATSGEVTINGINVTDQPEAAKKNIGYLPDTPPVYLDMRVEEYLNFAANIKGVKAKHRKEMVQYVMEQVSIDDIPRRVIKNLSRGYKQRVGLAQAMLGQPKVIIMDEPTIGLDPKQIMDMREVVRNLGKKHTVILSSHIMQEVNAVCDRVMIINKGHIVASGTPAHLSQNVSKGANSMRVTVKGAPEDITPILQSSPIIQTESITLGAEVGTTDLILTGTTDIREAIFNLMSENSRPIYAMTSTELSLEEIFLKLTNEQNSEQNQDAIQDEEDTQDAGDL